jgi:DNA-3-methyladenine glycosylase
MDFSAASVLPRSFFARPSVEVAPDLLGCFMVRDSDEGRCVLRITEVEAYMGSMDPASHAYRGKTQRNAVMFGPAGHLYVYFTYGMHYCANTVCGEEGVPSGLLIRAGEVVEGTDLARARRPRGGPDRDLARGPARLTQALALGRVDNGRDLCDGGPLTVHQRDASAPEVVVRTGPRVGVAAAWDVPWRFWIDGDPTVSRYIAHKAAKNAADA